MKVRVLSRSGKELLPDALTVENDATVEALKREIQAQKKKWYPSRQRLTLPLTDSASKPVVLEAGKKLADYYAPGSESLVVVFKDLGPQVGYKTVFFWEYLGPLVLYSLFYLFPGVFYPWSPNGRPVTYPVQTAAFMYWTFHYAKRILETFFVHSFSHATMPVFNLFRNCSYYWLFGVFVSYFVNHPQYTPVGEPRAYMALTFSLFCQLANYRTHVILKNLRSGGAGGYQIPRGFLFEYITCANYFTEILGWIGFNLATQTVGGYVFMFAGIFQMTEWAIAKHKRLRKLFDGKDGRPKYPKRWVIFPPLL